MLRQGLWVQKALPSESVPPNGGGRPGPHDLRLQVPSPRRHLEDAEDYLEPDELAPKQAPGLDPDSLQYKDACDGCTTHLSWIDACFICSHECTWCPDCAEGYGFVCPNCSGELMTRPRRTQPIRRY